MVIQLLKAKCLPVLFYGLEACHISKEQSKSLHYAIHSCFRKKIIKEQFVAENCMTYLQWPSVSEDVETGNKKT